MKKQSIKNGENSVETMTISTKTIEFDYSYEENDLVHLEMNLIELPFFNKNNKIKKNTSIIYNFNKDKSSYLQVKPGYNLSIPGEKEEKIFYALLKIFQRNNFLENKYCYTDYYEIIKEMEIGYSGKNKELVRKGLEILRETHYEFQNSFYTKMEGEHHKVSFNELKKLLNIAFITLDRASSEEEKKMFINNRKEIIRIELSEFIKTNIVNKIFLYFSKQDLLSLENAVTRNLWIKFTKWRNGKLFLRVTSKNIASKIPLSWTPSTYSKTILIIKKSLEDLKEKELIKSYEFVNLINGKKIKNEKTYFEIYFDEVHNEKRNNFTLGKEEEHFSYEYDTNIEHIEYKPNKNSNVTVQKAEVVEVKILEKSDNAVEELYSLLSEKGKKLSTMKGKLQKALKKNSFEETKYAILYTNKNSKTSYGKYFTDTLENKWYEEFMQGAKVEEEKKLKIKAKKAQEEIQQNQMDYEKIEIEKQRNEIKEKYSKLSEDERNLIEAKAYQNYIEAAGGKATKVIKDIFERAKPALIIEYLCKVNYFDINEIKEVNPLEEENYSRNKKDVDALLGSLGDSLFVEKKQDKNRSKIKEKIKFESELSLPKDKKDIIQIEKLYDDIISLKVEVHEYLYDKVSEQTLKQIMSFLNIESHYRREVENYRIEVKYVEDEKSFIYIEKLGNNV